MALQIPWEKGSICVVLFLYLLENINLEGVEARQEIIFSHEEVIKVRERVRFRVG